jgi:hypothetical protein
LTSGINNAVLGSGAGDALTSGSTNTFIGNSTGNAITTTSGNIMINNTGVAGDTNTIRIGTSQTSNYMQGILGNTPATSTNLVSVDNTTAKLGAIIYVRNQPYTTSNIVCDGGSTSINSMSIRGIPTSPPFPYPITYSQIGPMVFLRLPAFQVTSDSGGSPIIVQLASGIPVALSPSIADENQAITIASSTHTTSLMYKLQITIGGTLNIIASNGQSLATDWGFEEDITFTYTLT